MHLGKTGALFRASIRSGAILAGASNQKISALTTYADNFGLAFQITDDILDVVGEADYIGKPTGGDEKNLKATYVTLTSLDEAKKLATVAVQNALDAIKDFGEKANFLREIVQHLIERKK